MFLSARELLLSWWWRCNVTLSSMMLMTMSWSLLERGVLMISRIFFIPFLSLFFERQKGISFEYRETMYYKRILESKFGYSSQEYLCALLCSSGSWSLIKSYLTSLVFIIRAWLENLERLLLIPEVINDWLSLLRDYTTQAFCWRLEVMLYWFPVQIIRWVFTAAVSQLPAFPPKT